MKGKGVSVAIWAIGCLYILAKQSRITLSYFKTVGRCHLVNLIGLPCKFQPQKFYPPIYLMKLQQLGSVCFKNQIWEKKFPSLSSQIKTGKYKFKKPTSGEGGTYHMSGIVLSILLVAVYQFGGCPALNSSLLPWEFLVF